MSVRIPTPAEVVLEAASISAEEAARRARVSVPYLLRVIREGGAPYATARRLAAVLGCRLDLFLYRGGGTPQAQGSRRGRRAGSPRRAGR